MAKKKVQEEEMETLLGAPDSPIFKIQYSTNKVVWKFASDDQAKVVKKTEGTDEDTYEIEPSLTSFIPYAKKNTHKIFLRIAMSEDNGVTYTYSEPQEYNTIYGYSEVKIDRDVPDYTREELDSILSSAKEGSIYAKSYADMHGIKSPSYFLLKDTNALGYQGRPDHEYRDELPMKDLDYRKAINDNFDFDSLKPHSGLARRYDIQFLLACNSVLGTIYKPFDKDSDNNGWGGGIYPHVVTELFKKNSGKNLYFFNTTMAACPYEVGDPRDFNAKFINTAVDSRFLTFTERNLFEEGQAMKKAEYRSSMLFELGRVKSLGYFLGAMNENDSYSLPKDFLPGSEKLKPFYTFNMSNVSPLVYSPDTRDNPIATKMYAYTHKGYKEGVKKGAFYDLSSTPYKDQLSSMVLSDFAWRAFTDVHLMNNGYSLNTLMCRGAVVVTKIYPESAAAVGMDVEHDEKGLGILKQGHSGVFVTGAQTDSLSEVRIVNPQMGFNGYEPLFRAAREWNYDRSAISKETFRGYVQWVSPDVSHFESIYRSVASTSDRRNLAKKYSYRHIGKGGISKEDILRRTFGVEVSRAIADVDSRISIVPTETPLMYLNDHKCAYSILHRIGKGDIQWNTARASMLPKNFNSMVKSFHVEPQAGSLDRFDIMIDDSYNVLNFLSAGSSERIDVRQFFGLKVISGDNTSTSTEEDYTKTISSGRLEFSLNLNAVHKLNTDYLHMRGMVSEPVAKFRYTELDTGNPEALLGRVVARWSDTSELGRGHRVYSLSNIAYPRIINFNKRYSEAIKGLCADSLVANDKNGYKIPSNFDLYHSAPLPSYNMVIDRYNEKYGQLSEDFVRSKLLPSFVFGGEKALDDFMVVFPFSTQGYLGEVKKNRDSLILTIGDDGQGANDFPEDTYLSPSRERSPRERPKS